MVSVSAPPPKSTAPLEDRSAAGGDGVGAGAKGQLAVRGRVAGQQEVIVPGAEADVAGQLAVGDVERVAASAELDVAGDRRRREAGRNGGLLDRRAGGVGAKVDGDVAGRGRRLRRWRRSHRCSRSGPAMPERSMIAVAVPSAPVVALISPLLRRIGRFAPTAMSTAVAVGQRIVAADRKDLAGIAQFRRRCARAEAHRGRIAIERLGLDGAGNADAVGDRDRSAEPADLQAHCRRRPCRRRRRGCRRRRSGRSRCRCPRWRRW